MSLSRLTLCTLVVLSLLVPSAGATWSIVVVDTATGEVAVGTATCLEGTDLRAFVPVIAVGYGAGATQSQVDTTGNHKKIIYNGLRNGVTPNGILIQLAQGDLLKCSRQFGVVDMNTQTASKTGNCAGPFADHINGSMGTLTWAIQGNVITGPEVLQDAETALLTTPGRLSDKLMAAMEAARARGGDGRCSCLTGTPPSCGAPPAAGFEKSAHVGTVVLARIGDPDGTCFGGAIGCANGDYWMSLNFRGVAEDIDPVFFLQAQYDNFLERLRGHPDGLESRGFWRDPTPLPGGTLLELDVDLRDLDGLPASGDYRVRVDHAPGSAGRAQRYDVQDHGDGTYTVRILAPSGTGTDAFAVRVDGGPRPATLYPYPSFDYDAQLQTSGGDGAAAGVSRMDEVVAVWRGGRSLDGPPAQGPARASQDAARAARAESVRRATPPSRASALRR